MAAFPYKDLEAWRTATSSALHKRSDALKALDKAIADYLAGKVSVQAVSGAFSAWKGGKTDWATGRRNQNRGMSNLERWITAETVIQVKPRLTKEEKDACDAVREANRKAMVSLFAPVTPTLKTGGKLDAAIKTATALKAGNAVVPSSGDGGAKVMTTVFGSDGWRQISALSNMVPLLNICTAAIGTVEKISQLMATEKARLAATDQTLLAPGAPEAALQAVQLLLEARRDRLRLQAASQATLFASGVAAIFSAGLPGIIAGGAISVGNALDAVRQLGRLNTQMKAAKDRLASGDCSIDLFKDCPLLGCYFLTCSDTSALINMTVSRWGELNWQYDVEDMVKQMAKIQSVASEIIKESPVDFSPLGQTKGVTINKNATTLGLPTGRVESFQQKVVDKVTTMFGGKVQTPTLTQATPSASSASAPAAGGRKQAWA